jgi:hypothetical protein
VFAYLEICDDYERGCWKFELSLKFEIETTKSALLYETSCDKGRVSTDSEQLISHMGPPILPIFVLTISSVSLVSLAFLAGVDAARNC